MPLEEIWMDVVKELNSQTVTISNTDELWNDICEIWPSLCTKSYITELIEKIPSKLKKNYC